MNEHLTSEQGNRLLTSEEFNEEIRGMRSKDELVEVRAFLVDGDMVAVPAGNMAALFRVAHDEINGETSFEWEGLAAITGKFNTVRRVMP